MHFSIFSNDLKRLGGHEVKASVKNRDTNNKNVQLQCIFLFFLTVNSTIGIYFQQGAPFFPLFNSFLKRYHQLSFYFFIFFSIISC